VPDLTCISCGKQITRRQKKKNTGLCDTCFRRTADRIAAELNEENKKKKKKKEK